MSVALDIASLLNSPLRVLYGLRSAVWESALQSLEKHWDHPHLMRPYILTVIDFTKPAKEPRLWMFNLVLQVPLFYTPVAHGVNSGGAGMAADKFSNTPGTNKSCIGGFATYHKTHSSKLGRVSGTGLRVHGLDKGYNDKALSRGIIFHGAVYVKESGAGRSHGCFATIPSINEKLLPLIAKGTFVYAYGGEDSP